ncbi:MAG: HAD family hydrolase [bacterium]|nr:HAD family hydrolase [bacterium]
MIDLDGTLLDIEVAFFLGPMVQAMHGCFEELLTRDTFTGGLFRGIEEIMEKPRPEGQTNQEGFTAAFSILTGVSPEEVAGRFDRFYRELFPTLNGHARPRDGADRFVREASKRGYRLVLATNPIFPTSAIVERLKWARVDPDLFDFIPGLETMGSCKPQVRYFEELAGRIGSDPARCLMVGNDVQQDLPASDAGMDTFLVEGHVVDRGTGSLEPGARGSFNDLAEMLGLR